MNRIIDKMLILLLGAGGALISVPRVPQQTKKIEDPKTGCFAKIGKLGGGLFGMGLYNRNGILVGWFGISEKSGSPGFFMRNPEKGWELFLGEGKGPRAGLWVKRKGKKKLFLGTLGGSKNGLEVFGPREKVFGFFRVSSDGKTGSLGFGDVDENGVVKSGLEIKEIFNRSAIMRIRGKGGDMVRLSTEKGKGSKIEIRGMKGGGSLVMEAGKRRAAIELQPLNGLPGIRLISSASEKFSGMKIFDFNGKERVRLGVEGPSYTAQKANVVLFGKNGKMTWSALPDKK